MTDLDALRNLRALAVAALPGPWNADVHADGSARVYFAPDATDEHPAMAEWIPVHGYGTEAKYIAAMDPTTALALLNENAELLDRAEVAEKYAEQLQNALNDARPGLRALGHTTNGDTP